jgi:hypothetical protein
MTRRVLAPVERMVDVFDRASTLTFSTVVRVRGELDATALEGALRALERLHPLLRAAIERTPREIAFVFDAAEPIPLRILEGPPAAIWELSRASIEHRIWPDGGPRAELTWLRHAPDHSSLLLSLHHLVSDGNSGIFGLRDLLRLLAYPAREPAALRAPGQNAFYPPHHGDLRWKLRAGALVARSLLGGRPQRLRLAAKAGAPRKVGLTQLQLGAPQLDALARRARADGATVHGVLSAAIARGVAEAAEAAGSLHTARQNILHAVDLRRYLRAYHPGSAALPETMGYYVSSVETQHLIDDETPLGVLASEISAAVRAKKAEGEPLLMGPIAGAWLTRPASHTGELRRYRDFLERNVMLGSFAITNLGQLEQLGVQERVGALRIEQMCFVAAGSVFSTLVASPTTFGGVLSMPICWLEPLVSRASAECVAQRVERELSAYAAGTVSDHGARVV